MSQPFRATLFQLKPDLSGLGAAGDSVELGPLSFDDVVALAEKLRLLDVSLHPRAEPAMIVRRSDKGWRIAPHNGKLRVYESTSALDNFWTVENGEGLALLTPFRSAAEGATATPFRSSTRATTPPAKSGRFRGLRLAAEMGGLIVIGVVLMAVGLWFGTPRRKLSAPPKDVTEVSSPADRQPIFAAVAGTYVTGKKPGDRIVTITPQGQVTLTYFDKNGNPTTPPTLEEQANAGRRGTIACVLTSFGVISLLDQDSVKVGNYEWKRAGQL